MMLLALLPILAFGAPVEDSPQERMYGKGPHCVGDIEGKVCCSENIKHRDAWYAAMSLNGQNQECDSTPNNGNPSEGATDIANDNGFTLASIGVSDVNQVCSFTCPHQVNDDLAKAGAVVGTALLIFILLPVIIGVCCLALCIYCCCCKKKQPQTVIVQQAAQ